MIEVLKLNSIAKIAIDTLGKNYNVTDDCQNPEAVLVRSFAMHDWTVPQSLKCVARAGAGVNNIPCEEYAKKGIVVFNTPGANANAVKELVLASLFISSRNIFAGSMWASKLEGDDIKKQVEKGKGQFAGTEILGKTIGILGLGAIGRKVAEACNALGMKVVGYDPYVSQSAKEMTFLTIVNTMDELFAVSDFVTLHLPYLPTTKNTINKDAISKMKDGVIILNCARGELVNTIDVKEAIQNKKIRCYVTDFPDAECINSENIIAIPHLGASSAEAEDNCAEMAGTEIKLFMEDGTIKNSVNMPAISVAKTKAHRASVIFEGELNFEVAGVVTNKDGISYAIIESDDEIDISKFDFAIKARVIY